MSKIFLRAFLATLPILGFTPTLMNGVIFGGVGVTILFLSLLIFFLLHSVIPKGIRPISLLVSLVGVMWLGSFYLKAFILSPVLLVSLCVLIQPDYLLDKTNWKRAFQKTLISSSSFWAILIVHAALVESLGTRLGIYFFNLPAGSYLSLGLALAFFPKRDRP